MALLMTAPVVQVFPTKSGNWTRLIMATGQRVNDLVMVPADHELAGAQPGQVVTIPVRAQVETNQDGRPTKNITYWLDDDSRGVTPPASRKSE